MNYARALAFCGATLITATVIGTTATSVHARPVRSVTVVARPADSFTRHVSYADLNLASASDVQILRGRVGNAVDGVCTDTLNESFQLTMEECTSGSWNRARPQIARAARRARDIAASGSSSIAAVAITIGLGR
jgi:UrcA family protein